MVNLSYVIAQFFIFAVALSSYIWCDYLGICNFISQIVLGCVFAYFLTFFIFRRSLKREYKDHLKESDRPPQPWE